MKRSKATVNRELSALSKIFELAILERITMENPVRLVRELHGLHRVLTIDSDFYAYRIKGKDVLMSFRCERMGVCGKDHCCISKSSIPAIIV